jgi:hypothetical protein
MAAPYSIMEDQETFSMQNINDSLPGRILTVLLATLTMAGLFYLVFFTNRGIVPAVLRWVLVAALGLAAGFAARAFLPGRTLILRFFSALLGVLAGLIFLGIVSRGLLGTVFPASNQEGLNLGWVGEFALASAAAWLSLSAWKISPQSKPKSKSRVGRQIRSTGQGPKKRQTRPKKTVQPQRQRTLTPAPRAHSTQVGQTLPMAQREFWERRWKRLQSRLRHWWEHGIEQPQLPLPRLPKAKRPAVRLQARHKRQVTRPRATAGIPLRLIGIEEHRCPFCLEVVEKNDPRGVKVCPICHTYHHADCWEVTGTCQVPHYHG